jgi:hypothetical protein
MLEATNAFELRIFRGHGTRLNATKATRDLDGDAERGVFQILPVPTSAWDVARRLSAEHSGGYFPDVRQNQVALAQAEGLQTPIRF